MRISALLAAGCLLIPISLTSASEVGQLDESDIADIGALLEDIDRRNMMIATMTDLQAKLASVGADVAEAASRILLLAAMGDLTQRVTSHHGWLEAAGDDCQELLQVTMTSLLDLTDPKIPVR